MFGDITAPAGVRVVGLVDGVRVHRVEITETIPIAGSVEIHFEVGEFEEITCRVDPKNLIEEIREDNNEKTLCIND